MLGDFIDLILTELETHPAPGDVDDVRCIMWDNLALNKTAYVTNKICGRPSHNHFFSVDHPPYRLTMAPIEFVFCELASELSRRIAKYWIVDTLRVIIVDISSKIERDSKFENIFVHCNYPFN